MFDPREQEDHQANETSEEKLIVLQNNIQHVERKIRLAETEKKADRDDRNSNIKKNELEIKRLKMEVQELEARLERCQKADESMISGEFQKHFRDIGNFTGKSAKEVLRQLESEALELQRKSKSSRHELELKTRTMRHNEEQHEEMVSNCDAYFENEPTEYHSLQYIRELENEHQKISKYITESEIAENVLKHMKNQLEKNLLSNAHLLQDVQREYELEEERAAKPVDDDAAQQGETALTELKKEVRFLEDGNLRPEKLSEQETELLRMKANFERIKEATGVSDIQDAENRILEQKALEEKLSDLKKLFAKTLLDLKVEKKQLGSSARCPERELEDELSGARTRLKEQERRKERTALELEKTGTLLADVEGRIQKLMQAISKELPYVKMATNPNITVLELEEFLRKLENYLSLGVEEKSSDKKK